MVVMRLVGVASFVVLLALLMAIAPAFRAAAQDRPKIEVVPRVGHSAPAYSVAFSTDGRQVLSGSGDNTLKLWDAATGALLRTFRGHSGGVKAVMFFADGKLILSASLD